MERNDAKPLKAAIQQFIRAHRMQGKLDEVMVKAWAWCLVVFVEANPFPALRWTSCGSNWTAARSRRI